MNPRDAMNLESIVGYCDDILVTVEKHGKELKD